MNAEHGVTRSELENVVGCYIEDVCFRAGLKLTPEECAVVAPAIDELLEQISDRATQVASQLRSRNGTESRDG